MKNIVYFLLLMFLVIGCSNEVTQKENKNNTNKKSVEKSSVVTETSSMNAESNEVVVEEEEDNAPIEEEKQEVLSLNIGETYSNDDLEVTIQKVEYVGEGIRVYLEVFNKSNTPLEGTGGLQFKLDDPQFEKEFNNLGFGHYFNKNLGYVYKGEKRSGYCLYLYDRDVKIKEIQYFLMESGMKVEPIANWIIE